MTLLCVFVWGCLGCLGCEIMMIIYCLRMNGNEQTELTLSKRERDNVCVSVCVREKENDRLRELRMNVLGQGNENRQENIVPPTTCAEETKVYII